MIKLQSLRVAADFDASAYARGASQKAASDDLMIRSGDRLGVSLAKADQVLDRTIPGMARLSRAYIDGYSQAEKFEKALLQVGNAMDKGMSPDRAVAMLINLESQFKRVADASELAKRGLGNVASVVTTAHIDQSGINSLVGANSGTTKSAQESMAVFEQAAQEQNRLAKAAELLRLQVNPLAAAQTRLNAELAEYTAMANAGVITTEELGTAQMLAGARFSKVADDVKRHTNNVRLNNFELVNLQYQLSDIAVSLQSGQSPFTVMMQQGSQIAQIFQASGANALGILKAVGAGILTWLTSPLNLAVIGFAAATAAGVMAFRAIRNELPPIADLLKKQKEDVDGLQEAYGNIPKQLKFLSQEASSVLRFKVQIDSEDVAKSLKKQVNDFLDENQPQQGFRYSVNTQNLAFLPQFKALKEALKTGVPDITEFRKQVVAMYDAAGDNTKMKKLIDSLIDSTDALEKAQLEAKNLADHLRYLETFHGSSIRITSPLIGNADQAMAPLAGILKDNRSDRQKLEETYSYLTKIAQTSGEVAAATDVYTKATGQLNSELDKQRQLANLDIQAISAKSPAEKASIAATRERISALNTSADAQTTDMRATMAAKNAYQQATFAMSEASKMRMMSANDNNAAAQVEIDLIGKSASERDLASANLKTYQELQKSAFNSGTSFNQAEYEALVKQNQQHAQLIQKLSTEKALYDIANDARLAKMNPLDAEIDRKMTASGVSKGSPEYDFVKRQMQDVQTESRTFTSGVRSAFYEIENTITDLGTTTKDFFTGLYQSGESMFVNFAKTGKMSFDDITSFALESLGKITYQFAVSGLLNLFGGSSGGGGGLGSIFSALFNANGNAFEGGQLSYFANGGAFTNSIINRPTMFAYGGKFGVMGEAGPEAIMPLARGRDGKLGVAAANNNSAAVVQHKVNVQYYGQSQPDISSHVDQMGQLQLVIREIARNEAAQTIRQSLPTEYGVTQRRVMR